MTDEKEIDYNKLTEDFFKTVLCDINEDVPERCPYQHDKKCTDCEHGRTAFRQLQDELLQSLCEFTSFNGIYSNHHRTIMRSESVDMAMKDWEFLKKHGEKYEEMDTDDIPWAYVKLRYPELWRFVEYKNYRKPHKYLFKDDESPLIAVYEGAVYTVAPRLTEDDTEEEE